jgi:hypothetical protein
MVPGRLLPIVLAASLLLGALPARAQDDEGGGPTPPRLSYLDGEVSFWRPGAEDWAPAHVNTPLAEGDSLYTGAGANAELQIGPRAFVRAGEDTELGVDGLDPDFLQLKATSGHVALDLRSLPRGQRIEVDTPNAAITIEDEGYYRVIVGEAGTRVITRRGGRAIVTPAGGEQTDVAEDTEVAIEGDAPVRTQEAPPLDAWDHWNYERGDRRPQPARRYVPENVYGGDELDENGSWREEPDYGEVWYPRAVAADWAPYSAGRWVWDPFYGWTWCDDAPWGWAPFHSGRWVSVNGFWGWAPGPIVASAVYAPALVAFLGPVSVGVGVPFVSWVALGWGEPCLPWWGGHVGHPWWGGWGGPRVNIVNVNNVNVYNVYRNTHVRNAVVAVQHEGFGRGRPNHRLDPGEIQHLRAVPGRLDVKPQRASLVPGEGRGRRPPESIHNRSVVSTREPRDPGRRLRAEGLPAPAESGARQRRIVEPSPRQHGRPGEPVRSRGFESPDRGSASEPPQTGAPTGGAPDHGWRGARPERQQPPPPPRHERQPRDVGGAPEPPRRHRDAAPDARVAPEPRQSPRGFEPDRRPPPRERDSGERAAPPPRPVMPEPRTQQREEPPRSAPAARPAPSTGGGGGGAPNHRERGRPEQRSQRFTPPPPPRTVHGAQPARRTASAPPRHAREFVAREKPRPHRPPAQVRSAPRRNFARHAATVGRRTSQAGHQQGRRHRARG